MAEKLTEAQIFALIDLSEFKRPVAWTGPMKAMGNKLVKMGLATYRYGYPVGFEITPAGRRALGSSQ